MPQKSVNVYTQLSQVPPEWLRDFPLSAEEALKRSVGKYFDSVPCSKGHFSLKNQSGGKYKGCVTCSQLRQREKTNLEREERGVKDFSFKDFVREANIVHGEGRYNYDLFEEKFSNKKSKYWIVCPGCCCFLQMASKHLSGQGCNKCSLSSAMRERRLTQKEYVRRCEEVHEGKYDLSEIKYTSMHETVTPICRVLGHGLFETEANNFMRGRSGCKLCAGLATAQRCRSDTLAFVNKAKKMHGVNKYKYDLVNYLTSKDEVKIICPINGHGIFSQLPSVHLSGGGCKKCAELSRAELYAMTLVDFLARARQKHGDKYDYSLVRLGELCGEKSRGHAEVEIVCPSHGSFFQSPLVHFRSGCRKCHMEYLWNEVRAIGREEWISRCQAVHGKKYDYSNVHDFSKVLDEVVTITCPIRDHGEFTQGARNHMAGRGCQKCGDLNRGRDSYYAFLANELWAEVDTELYLVEAFGNYYKFGIAIDFEDRSRGDYTDTFYRKIMPRAVAWTAEQYLLLSTVWAAPGFLPPDIAGWGGNTELRNKDFSPSDMAIQMDMLVENIEEIGWREFCEQNLIFRSQSSHSEA